MEILTANSGSYPRVGPEPEHLRLREAYQEWEKGEVDDAELEEVYQDYTKEVIREQEEAGLDVVTDGQLRWYDPLSHFAKGIEGCEVNGLLRYFDTNFYYRQPVVKGDLRWDGPILKDEFLSAKNFTDKVLKPVVTGPYTLAKNSINQNYGDFSDLVSDFAEAISEEVKELAEAGAEEIQINDPAILKNPDDFDVFTNAVEEISKVGGDVQLDLYFYFGDSTPLYEELQTLPVDMLGLDFTYSPGLPEKIRQEGFDKILGMGLIDARNTKMEDKEEVVTEMKGIISETDVDKVYLNPSCGIEFLPRERALEKLENMVEIADEVREVMK